MGTYITEKIVREATRYGFFAGPEIQATSWEDAEKKAIEQGVILVGKLDK